MDSDKRFAHLMVAFLGMGLSLGLTQAAMAQQSGNNRPSSTDRAIAITDLNLRDAEVRSLEIARDSAKSPVTPKATPQTIEQVQQDFGRLQEINTEVMKAYAAGGAPDYQHIGRAMAEINKRAHRLNTNLTLPELNGVETPHSQNRSPLLDLNELITRFVTNPIFKNANTMDAELAAKAKRDLVGIIDLSHRIEKSAHKLAKSEAKP